MCYIERYLWWELTMLILKKSLKPASLLFLLLAPHSGLQAQDVGTDGAECMFGECSPPLETGCTRYGLFGQDLYEGQDTYPCNPLEFLPPFQGADTVYDFSRSLEDEEIQIFPFSDPDEPL